MTDINDILDNATQWATEGVTKPTIKLGQVYNIEFMKRGIVVQRVRFDDDLIGVIDRNRYSVNSHEIWTCVVCTMTSEDDIDAILGCIKRICAEYEPTATENHLEWQGGDIIPFNNVRWTVYFAIIQKKSMVAEW